MFNNYKQKYQKVYINQSKLELFNLLFATQKPQIDS